MAKNDPYAEGYSQGFSDYEQGKPRLPHDTSRLLKFVLMSSRDVEGYVQAYHQGYEAAVRQKRNQRNRHHANRERDAQTQHNKERIQKARQQGPFSPPDLER